jgi:hypothetical protein
VKSGQMLSTAEAELRKYKRIRNPSKLKCFTLAHNIELRNEETKYV